MMKRIGIVAVGVVVALWLAAILLARTETRRANAAAAAVRTYPPMVMSLAAQRLSELMVALDLPHAHELPWREYVDSPRALPPPPDVAVYFGNHVAALDAVRKQLLSRQPLTWPEIGSFSEHLLLTRILVAHAASHHDWTDLEAAWRLTRPLWDRPDLMSCMVALAGMRMINGAANKLPAPAPPWFGETLAFDVRQGMLDGQLSELMTIRHTAESTARTRDSKHDLISWIREPYDVAVARNFETVMREAATNVARSDQCNMDVRVFEREIRKALPWWNRPGFIAVPNVGMMWQRVGRFRAERQATVKRFNLKTEPCS
jgi:hypothetical protein